VTRPAPRNAAIRGEPRSVGSARARDPLSREVRLLGALLGQVIAEQEGPAALLLVERVRGLAIALRRRQEARRTRRILDQTLVRRYDVGSSRARPRLQRLLPAQSHWAEEKERALRTFSGVVARRGPQGGRLIERVVLFACKPLPSWPPPDLMDRAALVERNRGAGDLDGPGSPPTRDARRRNVLIALRRDLRPSSTVRTTPRLTPDRTTREGPASGLREEIRVL